MSAKPPSYDHFYDEKTGEHLGYVVDNEVRTADGEVIRRIIDGQAYDKAGNRMGLLVRDITTLAGADWNMEGLGRLIG
jgi:hypothetical protein